MYPCHLVYKFPSNAPKLETLEEVWSGRRLDFSILRVFGCLAFVHQSEGKLEPRSQKCGFLGFPKGVMSYRLWVRDLKVTKSL